jgi:hypothetical protein
LFSIFSLAAKSEITFDDHAFAELLLPCTDTAARYKAAMACRAGDVTLTRAGCNSAVAVNLHQSTLAKLV